MLALCQQQPAGTWHDRPTHLERAADLNAAFADPAIRAILAVVGGEDQITVIPHLDPVLARRDPKPFLGTGDNTNIHHWLWANGIASFYSRTEARSPSTAPRTGSPPSTHRRSRLPRSPRYCSRSSRSVQVQTHTSLPSASASTQNDRAKESSTSWPPAARAARTRGPASSSATVISK
jgi:hypothetical protein